MDNSRCSRVSSNGEKLHTNERMQFNNTVYLKHLRPLHREQSEQDQILSTGDTKTRINSIDKIDSTSEEYDFRSNRQFSNAGYASQANLRQSGKINTNVLPPKSTMQKQYLASNGHIEYKQTPL